MKKIMFIFCGLLLLSGCTEENTKDPDNTKSDVTIETTEPVDNPTNNEVGTETDGEQGTNLSSLEEFNLLSDHIDLSTHSATVEEDNEGKRVILFSDETGKKTFKSIFVKHDQHLKIISLNDDGLLYNGQIK